MTNPFASAGLLDARPAAPCLPRPGFSHVVSADPASPFAPTLGALLDGACAAHGPDDALRFAGTRDDGPCSWYGLRERSDELAAALSGLGLRRGDRLAVRSGDVASLGTALFAAARTGTVLVPVDAHAPADAFAAVLNASGAVALLCSPVEGDGADGLGTLRLALPGLAVARADGRLHDPRCPELAHVLIDGDGPGQACARGLRAAIRSAGPAHRAGTSRIGATIEPHDALWLRFDVPDADGTLLRHEHVVGVACDDAGILGLRAADRVLVADAPRNPGHALGWWVRCASAGATMLDPTAPLARDVATVLAGSIERATHTTGDEPTTYETDSVRLLSVPVSPAEIGRGTSAERSSNGPAPSFSVALPGSGTSWFRSEPDAPRSLRLRPRAEAKVVDADARVVPCGTTGELCVRDRTGLPRAWCGGASVEPAAVDDAGWWHTGLRARVDDAGRTSFVASTLGGVEPGGGA